MKTQKTFLIFIIFVIIKNLLAMDLDDNGIEDYNEQILANMFCPSIVLDAEDGGVSPEPVEIMETTSEKLWMRVYNTGGQFVFEKQVFQGLSWNPSVSYWTESLDYNKNYSWFSEEAFKYTGSPTGYAYGVYYQQMHYEWAGQGNDPTAWRAAYSNEAATNAYKDRVYVNLWKESVNEYVIQYWFFYPFNDCANKHEGDWEHINVIISSQDPSTASIIGIDYYFHKKVTRASIVNQDYFMIANTHPVVFVGGYVSVLDSGPGSHGSYPVKGEWENIGAFSADEIVHGDGRFIHYNDFDIFVLPHNPNVIDYMENKKMCWLKANIPWGHWDISMKGDWIEFLFEIGNSPPVGPYYNAYDENTEKGKSWFQTGPISGDYDNYAENWPYRPVTNSGWSPPSVQTPPVPPVITQVNRTSSQVTLNWSNNAGAAGTKIYYSQDPHFDRFYEYDGTGLNEGDSPIVISNPTTNSYTLHGLSGVYYFALSSFNGNGESWFSNEVIAPTNSGYIAQDELWYDNTLIGNVYVPSGVTLTIASGATINLNGYYLESTGGTIIRQNAVTFQPGDFGVRSGTTIIGQYPTFTTAHNKAVSGQAVHIGQGTYNFNISMKSGVDVVGAGDYWTTLNGCVEFYDVNDATLSDVSIGYYPVDVEYSENIDIEDVAFMANDLGLPNVITGCSEVDIEGCQNFLSGQSGAYYPVGSYGSDLFLFASDIHDAVTAYEAAYYSTGYVHLTTFCGYNAIDIDATSGYPYYDSYVHALYEVTFSDNPYYTCLGFVDYPYTYQTCGWYKESAATAGLNKSSTEDPPVNPDLRDDPEYQDFIEALDLYYAIKIKQNEAEESGQSVSPESYISDYETIVEKLKAFIERHPEDELAGTAMRLIGTIYQKLDRPEEIINYTNTVLNDAKLKKAEWHAKRLLLAYHIKQNNTQFALTLADELVEETEKEDQKCLMLYEKGLIYKHSAEDQKKAAGCFDKIIKKYSDNPISELAALQLELLDIEPDLEKSSLSLLPEEDGLALTNYPNPSNPETVIHFRLPEQGEVTLRIFDIRGREVQTLVDKEMVSGEHRITWDGKDSMGNLAASGIYFYQIQFRDRVLTKKMTLIR